MRKGTNLRSSLSWLSPLKGLICRKFSGCKIPDAGLLCNYIKRLHQQKRWIFHIGQVAWVIWGYKFCLVWYSFICKSDEISFFWCLYKWELHQHRFGYCWSTALIHILLTTKIRKLLCQIEFGSTLLASFS